MIIGKTNSEFLEKEIKNGKRRHTDYDKMKALGYGASDFQQLAYYKSFLIAEASDEEFKEFLTEERCLAEKAEIHINQVHGPWPVHDEIEEDRPKNVLHMKKCIDGASLLGADSVVYHPVMPEGWGTETDEAFAFSMNVKVFTEVGLYAKECGINVAIENLPFRNISLARTENLRKLVDEINMPNVGICLDTGHVLSMKLNLPEAVKVANEKLFCLHVHDNRGAWDDTHQVPFLCSCVWYEFMDALKEIGYKGVLSLESGATGFSKMPLHLSEMFLKFEAETAKYLASLMDE